MEEKLERLRLALDLHHEWPCDYVFKFVVPAAKAQDVKALFVAASVTSRASRVGRYVSVTAVMRVASADEVLMVYRRAAAIEGLIAL